MDHRLSNPLAACQTSGSAVWSRMTDGDDSDRVLIFGETDGLAQVADRVHAKKSRGQSFIHGSEKYPHHRCSRIHPPKWDGPFDFFPVCSKLVSFSIALVVGLLTHTDDDVDRSLRDPGVEAGGNIRRFVCEFSDLPTMLTVRNQHETDTLRVACRGRFQARIDDSLDAFTGNRGVGVVSDHPAFGNDMLEFHTRIMALTLEKRVHWSRLSAEPIAVAKPKPLWCGYGVTGYESKFGSAEPE